MNKHASADVFQPSPEMAAMLQPKVGVCVPSGPFMVARTAFCIQCMSIISAGHGVREIPMNMEGADPASARNQMAEVVIDQGADWLLFIDPDMQFPPNSLLRLLHHGVDIVGVDYRRRGPPYNKLGDFNAETMPQADHGLIERNYLGLGLFLVRKTVFDILPKPWFSRVYEVNDKNRHTMMTEDLWFGYHARKAGFKIWCDIDLTREVLHIGSQAVPWDLPNHAEAFS